MKTFRLGKYLFLVLSLIISSFILPLEKSMADDKNTTVVTVLQYPGYEDYLESALVYRQEALKLGLLVTQLIRGNEPLTAEQMTEIYEMNVARQMIFEELKRTGDRFYQQFRKAEGAKKTEAALEAFNYYLLLDDNYLLADILFQKAKNLRRLMNEDNATFNLEGNGLQNEVEHYYSFKMMSRKAKLNNYLNDNLDGFSPHKKGKSLPSGTDSRLVSVIKSSYNYQYKYSKTYGERFKLNMRHIGEKFFTGQHGTVDFFRKAVDTFLFGVSYAFGQTIGQIQWKKGSLYNKPEIEKKILSGMKPMDVLFDKTRNKVSGKIIPGFWNHNGIYLGNEEDFKRLGIWEHPIVVPHQEKIKQGRLIIEALKDGVVMNTLAHFLNVDDIAVSRKENLTDEEVKSKLLIVMSQLGKSYDYNFNTNSTQSIICSELVLIAFPDIKFRQTKLLGKWSNTPTDVAYMTLPGGDLKMLSLWYDGQEATSHLEWHMNNLIRYKRTDLNPKDRPFLPNLDLAHFFN